MSTEQKLQTISTNNTIIAENEQKVYEAGKAAEWSKTWDGIQDNGERVNYQYAFAYQNISGFKPKYDIVPTATCESMMTYFDSEKIDFVEYLDSIGITMDFSKCTRMNGCFANCKFTRLGIIDLSAITGTNGNNIFLNMSFLKTIDKIIFSEKTQVTASTFSGASALENLTIEGVIATNGFNVSYCKLLTHDSLMSIISALKDYSGDTSGTTYKVILGSTNLAKLTDEEKAIATQKGWTLA